MDVSKVFDPKYVFTVYFPLAFGLKWALGVQLLGTLIVVEWLNQVLKWLMRGDRPYWWVQQVHETNGSWLSTGHWTQVPDIAQFPSTCETGPGTPSGHSMAMSAVWYVITHSLVHQVVRSWPGLSATARRNATLALWGVFAAFQLLVITSRIYIAAHFPHQCLLGLYLGVLTARKVYGSTKWLSMSRTQWLLTASFILTTALSTYWLLLVSGSDPAWSIRHAYKWCARREYIHVDTTPFYSMVRYSGAAFGLGLGLTSRFFASTDRSRFNRLQVAATVLLGLVLGAVADKTHALIPKADANTFYALEFALNVALPYGVVGLVPHSVQSLFATKTKSC